MFHHKLLRRLLALICALALCLGLSGPVSAAGDVYFSVVNDSMITLSDSTMPVWSGGVLYVPHSVFDGTNSTGIGFGLNFSYNRDTGIASLFTTQQILTFDLNRGISYDYISGTPLKGRAILRNGRPYLPVGQVCSFFGLSYSVIAIPEGHIVRVKNSAVSLSDAAFVDAASNLISRYLREYSQSQQSPPTPGIRPPTSSGTDAPLQEEGWVCWNETVNAVPAGSQTSASTHANAVIRKIGSQRNSAYLTLDAGTDSARVLPILLQRLGSRSYPISVPLETRL